MCSQLVLFGWISRGVCVTVNHTSNASVLEPKQKKIEKKLSLITNHNLIVDQPAKTNAIEKK